MPNIFERVFKRYRKRARSAVTNSHVAEYRRGYLRGLRRLYRGESFGTVDEHVQWLGYADSPSDANVLRGYRDGIAGIEPQP